MSLARNIKSLKTSIPGLALVALGSYPFWSNRNMLTTMELSAFYVPFVLVFLGIILILSPDTIITIAKSLLFRIFGIQPKEEQDETNS